jgi:monofunctional glycosyltransferase
MPNSSRGRRLVSEQLSLLPQDESPRHPGVQRRGRRKLPSDRRIVGAIIRRSAVWALKLTGGFLMLTVGMTILYRFIDPPVTPLMLIRPIEAVAGGRVTAIDKKWVDIDDVNPLLLRSVIAAEDARFFTHGGVDWKAVEDARKYNERTKSQNLRGASTITMQCARNVFLWQGRNYLRKGLETYFTYLMETFWSKKRILEIYVNVIEWGDGIYGVEAAAQHYFGVSASKLSARQAALLASVLPNPRVYNAGAPDGYINRRASRIQSEAPIVSLAPLGATPKKKK